MGSADGILDASGGEPTNFGALIQLALVAAIIGICTLLFNYFFQNKLDRKDGKSKSPKRQNEGAKKSSGAQKKGHQQREPKVSKGATAAKIGVLKFKHEDHVGTLKAHSSEVTDMSLSSNGKYLASISSEDRSVILWSTKEFESNDRNSIRAKVELDNPVSVDFSPDCKALALGVELANTLKVMKIGKKEGATQTCLVEGSELPQVLEVDLLTCAISASGNYVIVADNQSSIYILSLRGDKYGKIDATSSGRGKLSHVVISPCGRFVAFCGYSPEVFIYEVEFVANAYKGVKRAMVLKGHDSAATHFAFSLDAVSVASVSSDGTWRLHSIDVRYKDNEEPKLVNTGQHTLAPATEENGGGSSGQPSQLKCMLSCNGKLLGIYDETTIELFNTVSGQTVATYSDFGTGLLLTKCLFDNSAKHALVSVGKQIVVLSIYKYYLEATIEGLELQLTKPMVQSSKTRLQSQLKDERKKLEKFIKEMEDKEYTVKTDSKTSASAKR